MKASTEANKTTLMENFTRHVEVAQLKREYYLDCIHKAEESIANEVDPLYGHYTFDFAQFLPHIKFMTPRTDVCHHCEGFHILIMKALTEANNTTLMENFTRHVEVAQLKREYYLDCIHKAEESIANEVDPLYGHYTFDFAQSVQVPYHAKQVGPLYFKSPLKVNLFGICNDGTKLQTNYIYDELQSIGQWFQSSRVILMLDHYFDIHSLNEPFCHLHADNCVGQNKNRFVLGYLATKA